ncbi:concanavalin A-like lectin/glucanase domain-containing protein [Glomus cerebriforme]|uniref:Concanavalin A-like lectin/glucanase domain-containing protein n=1 Tax=Glomus cerebriforme TaxID=658196 RepID=A0A397TFZ1_9GLOM|nr:concanavalin A-like lectin/glucanase domain-containing protein [Glomus cerebriforme]
MKKFAINEFYEIISEPITLKPKDNVVAQHVELPEVDNELSVALRLKLKSHASDWTTVFHKGNDDHTRTPGLWLSPNKSILYPRFSGNWDTNPGINKIGDGLLLNKWYHITYTLSDPEKRLDVYINGEWAGFYSIQDVQMHKVKFNDEPLYIGHRTFRDGFDGEISNFRYFNWRLSAEEQKKNYLNHRPFN